MVGMAVRGCREVTTPRACGKVEITGASVNLKSCLMAGAAGSGQGAVLHCGATATAAMNPPEARVGRAPLVTRGGRVRSAGISGRCHARWRKLGSGMQAVVYPAAAAGDTGILQVD